jgi:hypothetical protein
MRQFPLKCRINAGFPERFPDSRFELRIYVGRVNGLSGVTCRISFVAGFPQSESRAKEALGSIAASIAQFTRRFT